MLDLRQKINLMTANVPKSKQLDSFPASNGLVWGHHRSNIIITVIMPIRKYFENNLHTTFMSDLEKVRMECILWRASN